MLTALLMPVAACQTMDTGGTDVKLVACQSFKPISWSSKDTRETQDGVTEHNAVYKDMCN
jgi:hypothetical protein